MGVGGQRQAPAALPPGKTRYPSYKRLGGPPARSGRVWKISPPPGFDPRTVQPVASRYTDWALPAGFQNNESKKNAHIKSSMGCHPLYLHQPSYENTTKQEVPDVWRYLDSHTWMQRTSIRSGVHHNWTQLTKGAYTVFSKNLRVNSKFWALEAWNKASPVRSAHE